MRFVKYSPCRKIFQLKVVNIIYNECFFFRIVAKLEFVQAQKKFYIKTTVSIKQPLYEKLILARIVKKFLALYGTTMFNTELMITC